MRAAASESGRPDWGPSPRGFRHALTLSLVRWRRRLALDRSGGRRGLSGDLSRILRHTGRGRVLALGSVDARLDLIELGLDGVDPWVHFVPEGLDLLVDLLSDRGILGGLRGGRWLGGRLCGGVTHKSGQATRSAEAPQAEALAASDLAGTAHQDRRRRCSRADR